jgi:hypothetical protein
MIFLMFPDRLRYERLLRARFARSGQIRADEAPVEGPHLLQSLSKGAKTPEAAKKLINQVAAAIELRPQETAKALLRSTKKSNGTNAGLRYIIKLMRQHGAPVAGNSLDILVSGWAVCGALAKHAVVLGTLEASSSRHNSSRRHSAFTKSVMALGTLATSSTRLRNLRSNSGKGGSAHQENSARDDSVDDPEQSLKQHRVAIRVVHFANRLLRKVPGVRRRKYHNKVGCSASLEDDEEHSHLWTMLPPGEVLHCLRGGATTLDGEDFKQLLQAAWALFDECDAVSWMIEPKKNSDHRALQLLAAQEKLADVTVDSQPGRHAGDAEPMHQQLLRSYTVIHQLKEICDEADDGLLRRAALYGLPTLLERLSMWLHASVEQVIDKSVAKRSHAATHEMDSVVAKILDCFTKYEIAAEEGLGYEAPHHSCESFLTSRGTQNGGAAVVCEEAWKLFLHSRENLQRAKLEAKDPTLASDTRFCTHAPLTHSFCARPRTPANN